MMKNSTLIFLALLATLTSSLTETGEKEAQSNIPLDISKPYFLKEEDRYNVASRSSLNLHEQLPVGSYTVGQYPNGVYYLKEIQPFDLTGKKLYGKVEQNGQRILSTFITSRSGRATGVLLAGQKGSGKTLLAKYISVEAAKQGISTIVVNEAWSGERFNAFIQSVRQPAIVLFDEFEKVYRQPTEVEMKDQDRRHMGRVHVHDRFGYYSADGDYPHPENPNPSQDAILTLLDGVYPSNMLFLLTVNDKTKITKNMKNRPGRIYYVLDFSGLDSDFIRDYCNDKLSNKTHVAEVVSLASLFEAFSFDMLQALVQEMNFWGETPKKALEWMNIKLDKDDNRKDMYIVKELVANGKDITRSSHRPTWHGNPATTDLIEIPYAKPTGWIPGGSSVEHINFFPGKHLVSGNITSGEFVFEDKVRNHKVVLVRHGTSNPFDITSKLSI